MVCSQKVEGKIWRRGIGRRRLKIKGDDEIMGNGIKENAEERKCGCLP